MKKSKSLAAAVLMASAMGVAAPAAFGQTMVEDPSRSSNDFNINGGVSEGSPVGPGVKSNRDRQKEFNEQHANSQPVAVTYYIVPTEYYLYEPGGAIYVIPVEPGQLAPDVNSGSAVR